MLDLKTRFLISDKTRNSNYVLIYNKKTDLLAEKDIIRFFCPQHKICVYSSPDSSQKGLKFSSPCIAALRIQSLRYISNSKEPVIVLTNEDAIEKRVISPDKLEKFYFSISVGDKINLLSIEKTLEKLGYSKNYNAYNSGEYALRGEILDIVTADIGYRIELSYDEVSSIKRFNCVTQLSSEPSMRSVEIYSASEVIFDDEVNICSSDYFGEDKRVKNFLKSGSRFYGLDCILSSVAKPDNLVNFFAYCKNYYVLSDCDLVDLMPNINEFNLNFVERKEIACAGLLFEPARNFFSELKIYQTSLEERFKIYLSKSNFKNIIAASNEFFFNQIKAFLLTADLNFKVVSDIDECRTDGWIYLSLLCIVNGFVFSDMHFFTEKEFFGKMIRYRHEPRENFNEQLLYELQENDFIVHEDYGIGRLLGIEKIKIGEAEEKDFIALLYSGNNKLFLPVENIDKIKKYKDKDSEFVALDSLCGSRWRLCKERARRALKDVSEKLMRVSAERAMVKVEPIDYDEGLYRDFCQEFDFCETEGQISAILDIESDIENRVLIDRLICGGVGFGKTEVAMRAACIFVLGGFQVAFVAPTTILSRQNFVALSSRFKSLGVRVVELSGMVSARDSREVKRKIQAKEADIIVGTHAIFSRQINFAKLGLLVIDEEQSFGVKQKELLKERYPNVNVLSLSATPIPRTLNMSLSGIKDISIINTPPANKASTEVFVLEKENEEINAFIIKEIERSGQVFYISPRIKDLDKILINISKNIPNAKIKIAHGRMPKSELEKIMKDFYEGNFNILLSTSIVEAGIHIPNANTIVINDANLLGLSQLYQLIGRVGRSSVRGSAILVVSENVFMDNKAISRLSILKNKSIMTSHLSISMYDMDERGIGSLVGHEQSGNLKEAIGVEMYRSMLSEEIEKIKSGKDSVKCFSDIEVDLDAFISSSYIEDEGLRLTFYRRLAEAKSVRHLDELFAEIINRFGTSPKELSNLVDILKLKITCSSLSIRLLKKIGNQIRIEFNESGPTNPSKLVEFVGANSNIAKISPSGCVSIKKKSNKDMITFLNELLYAIS